MDKQRARDVSRHPATGWVLSPIIGGALAGLYFWNTTDDEVKPQLADHETRIEQTETAIVETSGAVQSNTVQTAFMGQKFASEDVRRLERKQRENPNEFTADDLNALNAARRRLEYTQSVLDKAMGMPEEAP